MFIKTRCLGVQSAPSLREAHQFRWGGKPPTSINSFPGGKGQFGPRRSGCENNLSMGWVAARGPPERSRERTKEVFLEDLELLEAILGSLCPALSKSSLCFAVAVAQRRNIQNSKTDLIFGEGPFGSSDRNTCQSIIGCLMMLPGRKSLMLGV